MVLLVLLRNGGRKTVPGGVVVRRQPGASSAGMELLAQGARCVGGLVQATALQDRNHQLDEVLMTLGAEGEAQVEAVNAAFLEPGLHRVGYLLRITYQYRPLSADGVVSRELGNGPLALGIGDGKPLDG